MRFLMQRIFIIAATSVVLMFNAESVLGYAMPSYMNDQPNKPIPCSNIYTYEHPEDCKTVYLTQGSTHTLTALDDNLVYAYFRAQTPTVINILGGDFCHSDTVGGDDEPKSGAKWSGNKIVQDVDEWNTIPDPNVKAYLKNKIHFMPGTNDYNSGMAVTDFFFGGVKLYSGVVDKNGCTGASHSKPVTVTNMTFDSVLGYYKVLISASEAAALKQAPANQGKYTGLVNNFMYDSLDPNFLGFGYVPYAISDTSDTGFSNVGINPAGHLDTDYATDKYKRYNDVYVDFFTGAGALTNNELRWYDLDQTGKSAVPCPNEYNGNGDCTGVASPGGDPKKWGIYMQLYVVDAAGNATCPADLGLRYRTSTTDQTDCTYTPPTGTDPDYHDYMKFNPKPNTHYRWIITRMYMLNVIQFAVPYQSFPPAEWGVTPSVSVTGTDILPDGTGRKYVESGTMINVKGCVTRNDSQAFDTPPMVSKVDYSFTGSANVDNHAYPAVNYPSTVNNVVMPGGAASVQCPAGPAPGNNPTPTLRGNEGDRVCFSHSITPANQNGETKTSVFDETNDCVYIYAKKNPVVQTTGNDVHAGSNCGAATGNLGTITGITTRTGSFADYVVTTAGTVSYVAPNSFNSNNSNGSGGNANAVSNYYSRVCRPNLYAEAITRYPATVPVYGSDITWLNGNVRHVPGSFNLSGGRVDAKSTLIVDGDLTISGNIDTNGAAFARGSLPSLGIIVNGRVFIEPGVTNIDAYVFSNSKIFTCSVAPSAAACGNTLTVNGFLMGNSIQLARTGIATDPSNASPVGERINMTPQLYLNPPIGFDIPNSFNFLRYRGERPPLY